MRGPSHTATRPPAGKERTSDAPPSRGNSQTSATLAVAAATLLAVGGTASATPSVDRTADTRSGRNSGDLYVHDSHHQRERNDNKWPNRGQRHSCDSHREWARNDNKWHHNNGGQRHSYEGRQFHRWNADLVPSGRERDGIDLNAELSRLLHGRA